MSDFFDFTERYLSTDGKEYIDAACVRETLGIVDEHVDIFGVIKKLKEERDGLKADLELTRRLYKEHHDFADKVCEAVDIRRPYTESGYDHAVKSIAEIKKERDELKEKCDKMKRQANAIYGVSCGKEPAFLCDVISYSWSFGAIDTPFPNNSIRVELNLTPTANYKGTFDLEDLKKYIQAYGREKKLGIGEASDIFDNPRYRFLSELSSELGFRSIVGPGNVEKTEQDILMAVKSRNERAKKGADDRREFLRKLGCELGILYPIVKPGTEEKVEADIIERIGELKEGNWPCENGVTFAAYMRKQFPKECEKWNVAPLQEGSVHDWVQYIFGVLDEWRKRAISAEKERDRAFSYRSKAQQEFDRYELAVGSLLGIPKESRDNVNAIEKSFTFSKKKYESLKEFRDNVCEIFDIPSSMADDQKQVLKEIRDFADRYYELNDFRADICEVLGIDTDELFGSPQQNDKYILEQVEKLKNDGTSLDRYARFRSNICTALCLGGETDDEDILKRVRMTRDCHDALCKDYTELRKAIWEAMDRKPETLPEENARLVGEVTELARGEKLLIEFRDAIAKAIGMEYPTTNQVILQNVKYIYKDREDAYEIVSKLNEQVTALSKAKEDLQQMLIDSQKQVRGWTNRCDSLEDTHSEMQAFRRNSIEDLKSRGFYFRPEEDETLPEIYDKLLKRYDWAYGSYKGQYRLRQMWHARYESEHERANGEHKRAEKLRSDVTALSNHIELQQMLIDSQANSVVASQAFKNECRKLKDEKTKVISALGQDIWDDCLKD